MNRVQQPRTLLVLGLNAGMSIAAAADERVETLTDVEHPIGTKAHPLHLIDVDESGRMWTLERPETSR